MKCPHCLVAFRGSLKKTLICQTGRHEWSTRHVVCPSCNKIIIYLLKSAGWDSFLERLVYPKTISRTPISPEVPEPYANDYREACLILSDSPKASAALSRRCLQNLLREKAGIKERNLSDEIKEVIDSKQLPLHLTEALDAIRVTGNFAAHPIKSTNSGEIVDVEPGEAEGQLDMLEGLFDFYFVQPAILQKMHEALNKKLTKKRKPKLKYIISMGLREDINKDKDKNK